MLTAINSAILTTFYQPINLTAIFFIHGILYHFLYNCTNNHKIKIQLLLPKGLNRHFIICLCKVFNLNIFCFNTKFGVMSMTFTRWDLRNL